MADLIEGRSAVREAIVRAEEAAGIFRDNDGNETYADPTTPVAPELEGAVPVSASDQPLPVEPPVVEATSPEAPPVEADPEPPAEPTIDELKAQLLEAEARVEEQKLMIGRQSSEVGETREQMAALKAQIDAVQAQQTQTTTPPSLVITQQLIEEDPARATQLAFEQNNGQVLAIAFEAWKDEDAFAAASWRADQLLAKQQADFQAQLEAVRGEVAAVKVPQAEADARNAWSEAFVEVQKEHADFLAADESGRTNAQRLLEDVAPQFPAIARLIADGDVEAKVQGLKLLYANEKLGNPAEMAAQLESAATEAAADAAAARAAASAVNGQPSAGQGSAVELTEEEAEVERYKARYSGGVSLSRGWTGRSNT